MSHSLALEMARSRGESLSFPILAKKETTVLMLGVYGDMILTIHLGIQTWYRVVHHKSTPCVLIFLSPEGGFSNKTNLTKKIFLNTY